MDARGRSRGGDCVRFDQTGASLNDRGDRRVLADRKQDIVALGRDGALAEDAAEAIRTNNSSEMCYIGGADAALTYLLS